jgi:hypothetical protein
MEVTHLDPKDGFSRAHRKENHFMQEYIGVAIQDNDLKEVVNLRVYGTQAKNYACVWYRAGGVYGSGSGSAGGGGYHRPSAAAYEALSKAGVELSEPISGRGDGSIQEAVLALTKKLYPNAVLTQVIKSHG